MEKYTRYSFILCLLLLMVVKAYSQNTVVYSAPDTTADSGALIRIPIYFDNNGNQIGAFGFQLDYDSTIVSFQGSQNGPIIPAALWVVNVNPLNGGSVYCGGVAFGGDPIQSSGVLLNLDFLVNPAAPISAQTDLLFSNISAGDYSTGLDLPVDSINGSISISSTNNLPVAQNDSTAVPEDGSAVIDVLANDYDQDGDSLTIQSVNAGGITGQVWILSGDTLLLYQTAPNFFGTEVFQYIISDGRGGLATAWVTVRVTPVNDPPLALDDSVTTIEDSLISIHVLQNDSDPDGDPLTVNQLLQSGTLGNAWIESGDTTVAYQPPPDFNGSDQFRYIVTDAAGVRDTAGVLITILGQNDAPVASDDTVATDEDIAVLLDVLSNDTDAEGDPLHIVAMDTTGLAGNLSRLPGDTLLRYIPRLNYFGETGFTYIVGDGQGGLDTADVLLRVKSVNDPPQISGLPAWVIFRADSSAVLDVWSAVYDVETPDSLLQYTFPASNDSLVRTFNNSSGILTLSAVPPFSGYVLMYVSATDDSGATATDSLVVIIQPAVDIGDLPAGVLPRQFSLLPNYPNPFNPSTTIPYAVPGRAVVDIRLYNSLGQEVAVLYHKSTPAGYHQIQLKSDNLASGLYFVVMKANRFRAVRRMMLIK